MTKIERVPTEVLFRSQPDGIMPEQQLEAILWGFYFRVLHTRDRRSEGGRSTEATNTETGLPESAASLVPIHRAVYGWELALELIVPPEDFCAAVVYTDDNETKEWQALCFKPKFKVGKRGRPICKYTCESCHHERVLERPSFVIDTCEECHVQGVREVDEKQRLWICETVVDNWSEEEVRAVKENSRRLKRIVHRLAGEGYFQTRPRIDEKSGELGTDELVHGRDEMTMGFRITPQGVKYTEEWAREHPVFTRGHTILDAMGETMAAKAPEWVKAELRHQALPIGNWW